ncbi:hypothetical protein BY458DRAFT_433176, partial [Sporodiniella umbellata]
SPFTIPNEPLWSKVKRGAKRKRSKTGKILVPRTIGVCFKVARKNDQNWIYCSLIFL